MSLRTTVILCHSVWSTFIWFDDPVQPICSHRQVGLYTSARGCSEGANSALCSSACPRGWPYSQEPGGPGNSYRILWNDMKHKESNRAIKTVTKHILWPFYMKNLEVLFKFCNLCDQIWRNFGTLGKTLKYWQFYRVYLFRVWQKFVTNMVNF